MYYTALAFSFLISFVHAGSTWSRLGQPMCRPDDWFGASISMVRSSQDDPSSSMILAIGSPFYSGSRYHQGKVEFFSLSQTTCLWESTNIANAIEGIKTEDRLGFGIALSCNAERVAISGDLSTDGDAREGFVRVYGRSPGSKTWVQVGQTLTDQEGLNAPLIATSFGTGGLELSCNGNLLKVVSGSGHHLYRFQQDSNTNDVNVGTWVLVKFIDFADDGGPLASSLAWEAPVLAVNNGFDENVTIYDIRGAEAIKRQVNVTLSNSFDYIQRLSLSNSGTRLMVGNEDGEAFVFQFLASENKWNMTGTGDDLDFGNSILLSGDGSTAFTGQGDSLYSDRLVTLKNEVDLEFTPVDEFGNAIGPTQIQTRIEEEDRWYIFGNDSPPNLFNGVQFWDFSVSSTGSILAMSSPSSVEIFFYPDDPIVANLDCFPDYELEATQECFAPPEEEEDEPMNIRGDIKIDDGSKSLSIAFGILTFVFLAAMLALIMFRLGRSTAASSKSKDTSTKEAKVVEEGDAEMEPLKQESAKNTGDYYIDVPLGGETNIPHGLDHLQEHFSNPQPAANAGIAGAGVAQAVPPKSYMQPATGNINSQPINPADFDQYSQGSDNASA